MTLEQTKREQALSALYQLEMVQSMAKEVSERDYPICEYAYLLDHLIQPIKEALDYTQTP